MLSGRLQTIEKRKSAIIGEFHRMVRVSRSLALLLFLVGSSTLTGAAQPVAEADLLIKGGQVIDGTGGPRMQADVAITGGRIVYVGRAPVKAKRVIDAAGKVVAP